MLFSSLSFILVFLPLTLAAVLLGRRIHGSSGARFALTAASLVFYGLWGWKLLPVLVLVAAANYRISLSIIRTARPGRKRRLALRSEERRVGKLCRSPLSLKRSAHKPL